MENILLWEFYIVLPRQLQVQLSQIPIFKRSSRLRPRPAPVSNLRQVPVSIAPLHGENICARTAIVLQICAGRRRTLRDSIRSADGLVFDDPLHF